MFFSLFISYLVLFCFQTAIARTSSTGGFYNPLQYNTYEQIEWRLLDISSTVPYFTSLKSIGRTYEKNDIWQITFSIRPNRPTIWIDCGIQARDWITHSTCMYIIDTISNHLLKKEINNDVEYLLDNFQLTIVPVVNPDGFIQSWNNYYRSWVKNMNPGSICDGVFISQNFIFKFGSYYSSRNQCDNDYIGLVANSEKETQAITKSLEAIHQSNGVFALFHLESSGQQWSYPWSYTTLSSPLTQDLDMFCEAGISAIEKTTGSKYQCVQASDLDKTRGGTLIDYAHNSLGITTVYSLALRVGPSETYVVPENEIEDTGKEILSGISAVAEGKSQSMLCALDDFSKEYKQFNEIEHHLKCIGAKLQSNAKLESIGTTFDKNDIWMVTFSNDFYQKKEIVWIDCGMLAREWLTDSTCIYIIDAVFNHFANEKDDQIAKLLKEFNLVVIPVVNPDGYVRTWTAYNRHWVKNTNEDGGICDGVYLAQNFGYMFGFPYSNVNECDSDYVGPRPFSELETKALHDILTSFTQPIFSVFHLESSGQKWMYPLSYSNQPSQFDECLQKNCKAATLAISNKTGKEYTCQQTALSQGTRGGTFVDYLHNDRKISLVYSLALRSGTDYPYIVSEDEISDTGKETLLGILAAVENARSHQCTVVATDKPIATTPGPSEA